MPRSDRAANGEVAGSPRSVPGEDSKAPRPARATAPARGNKRRASNWIPRYHGGWAMVIVPPIIGIVESNVRLAHGVVFALWLIGYFLFYAATIWLRSRMKPRYFPAVRAYGTVVAVLGMATLALAPYLWRWALLFIPLVAIAAVEAWKRDERSVLSGLDTIVAACLLIPVMFDIGRAGASGFGATSRVWMVTALFFGYFAGTVFYVKTNIRERGSAAYLATSITWHAAWTVGAVVLASRGGVAWFHVIVWVAILTRAIVVPLRGLRGIPVSVRAIGFGEVATCLAFTLSLY